MKKMIFLLGLLLATAAVGPELGFAKLVLDMPPILAGGKQTVCTTDANCASGSFCCGGTCYSAGNCCNGTYCAAAYCCSGTCSSTICPECTTDANCASGSFCCGGTCHSTGNCCNSTYCAEAYCCSGTCSTASCPTSLNDTGIVSHLSANDDSYYGRDVTVPDPTPSDGRAGFSFATVTGGCVHDNVTGLTWSPDKGLYYWSGIDPVVTNANNTGLCGETTKWRLPTVKELVSIVSYHTTGKTVDTTFFPTIQGTWYWTGTSSYAASNTAWGVNFQSGQAGTLTKGTLSGDNHQVILVHD